MVHATINVLESFDDRVMQLKDRLSIGFQIPRNKTSVRRAREPCVKLGFQKAVFVLVSSRMVKQLYVYMSDVKRDDICKTKHFVGRIDLSSRFETLATE